MKTAIVLLAFIAIACGAEEYAELKEKFNNMKHELADNINKIVDKVKKDVTADVEKVKNDIEKTIKKIKNSEDDIEGKIKDLVKKIIKEIEDHIQCVNSTCNMCVNFGQANNVCLGVEVDLQEFSITFDLKCNDKIIITKTFNVKNPNPVCIDIPKLKSVKVCLHPYDLSISTDGFHICMKIEVYGLGKELLSLDLNCMTIGKKESQIENAPKKE